MCILNWASSNENCVSFKRHHIEWKDISGGSNEQKIGYLGQWKYGVWYYHKENMSLYIHPNP